MLLCQHDLSSAAGRCQAIKAGMILLNHTTMLCSWAAGQLEQLASPVLAKTKPALIALKLCITRQKGFGRRTMVLKGVLVRKESCVPAPLC